MPNTTEILKIREFLDKDKLDISFIKVFIDIDRWNNSRLHTEGKEIEAGITISNEYGEKTAIDFCYEPDSAHKAGGEELVNRLNKLVQTLVDFRTKYIDAMYEVDQFNRKAIDAENNNTKG